MPAAHGPAQRLLTLAGIGLIGALLLQIGPERVVVLVAGLKANFAVIVACFACHESIRALALGRCLPASDRPSFRSLLRVRLLGEAAGALTRTGPFAAEPVRAWTLASRSALGARAYGASLSEFIASSCTSAWVTVAAVSLALWTHDIHEQARTLSRTLQWMSLGYAAAWTMVVVWRVRLLGRVCRWLISMPLVGSTLKAACTGARRMEDAVFETFHDRPATMAQVRPLEVLAQAMLVFEIYWTITSMGTPVSASMALLVEALVKAANLIQFAGITEAGYAVVFTWLGLTAPVGFALSLVKLLRSLTVTGIGLTLLKQLERLAPKPLSLCAEERRRALREMESSE